MSSPHARAQANNRTACDWQIHFVQGGMDIQPGVDPAWQWGSQLRTYGLADAMQTVESAQITSNGLTVSYQWNANVQELLHNRSDGIKADLQI